MKVFVATRRTQGMRLDDYCHTVDGELVQFPPLECDCPGCGCQWGMAGLASHKATTTVEVADLPLTFDELMRAVLDSLVAGGWGDPDDPLLRESAWHHAEEIVHMAQEWPVGAVLGRVDDALYQRGGHGAGGAAAGGPAVPDRRRRHSGGRDAAC